MAETHAAPISLTPAPAYRIIDVAVGPHPRKDRS